LPIGSADQYIARYMEATFQPSQQLQTSVHQHAGPEAWYVLTGAQCLRTPGIHSRPARRRRRLRATGSTNGSDSDWYGDTSSTAGRAP
jgi:hypothetical protein